MTPGGIESKDKYHSSKQLLFAYLASEEVLLDAVHCQQHVIDQVTNSVLKHVIKYNQVFPFIKKKFLPYFKLKTSSTNEGTNFGIKEHAVAVLPSHIN
jgi:hypothetical protein